MYNRGRNGRLTKSSGLFSGTGGKRTERSRGAVGDELRLSSGLNCESGWGGAKRGDAKKMVKEGREEHVRVRELEQWSALDRG